MKLVRSATKPDQSWQLPVLMKRGSGHRSHHDEPGCAVRAGIAPDRLDNYHKMQRDIRRESMTPLERRALLSMWKSRTKAAAVRIKMKRG